MLPAAAVRTKFPDGAGSAAVTLPTPRGGIVVPVITAVLIAVWKSAIAAPPNVAVYSSPL